MVARALVPELPWAPAIVLGAVVAPPDAAAATAVLRQLRPPHRILTILEGESLLNDASALLIYRLAVGAVAAGGFSLGGGRADVPARGRRQRRRRPGARRGSRCGCMDRVEHVPTAIILQFVTTFGVWILAEHIGLSGVLTMVCYAITVARTAPERMPARSRIPSYAVWETVVFALNILAFIFIGLQIRPILDSLEPADRGRYLAVAGAVLVTVIVVRLAWHMSFNAVIRWRDRRFGFNPPRPMLRPTVGSGLVISWAGMRGIVSLAAALALPSAFPYRDLIVLTAFSVVLGTLIIQGLTLKPLLRALDLQRRRSGRPRAPRRARARAAGRPGRASQTTQLAARRRRPAGVHGAPRQRTTTDDDGTAARSARSTRELHREALAGGAPGRARDARAATRLATTPSTRSKRSWTGSRWPTARKVTA